jgi:gliding motility-associated-like protein
MIMRFSILFFLIAISFCSFAQNHNNQWRFGFGSAIDFNTSPPSYPTGCALPTVQPPLITGDLIEGTASIADRNTGDLLFYTDGLTIWNSEDQPMPNGSNLGGSDVLSSYMAAVIFPMPGSCSKYYVFCIDDYEEGCKGITYSVVDMSLDNGLGDVVAGQKSIPLYDNETELLLVQPKSSGDGYWLISNGTDPANPSIAAFNVTAQGINTTPVLSPVNFIGSGKLNYQGTKFICTGEYDAVSGNFLGFQLYDFNAASGQISNPVNIPFNVPNGDILQYFEFTFNGNYLFAGGNFSLYRFDLTSTNPAIIATTAVPINFVSQTSFYGAAQHGPDGNLYYAINPNVYRIENPEGSAAAIGPITQLPASIASNGCLPQWIALISDEITPGNNVIAVTGDACFQSAQTFSISGTSSIVGITWNFGDPSSGTANTSNLFIPSHQFSSAGIYLVTAFVEFDCYTDTLQQQITINDCPPEPPPAGCPEIFVPTIFTPNGSGDTANNTVCVYGGCIADISFQIFNRWGEKVFETNDASLSQCWDGKFKGKELNTGTFVYLLNVELTSGERIEQSGNITLIR